MKKKGGDETGLKKKGEILNANSAGWLNKPKSSVRSRDRRILSSICNS